MYYSHVVTAYSDCSAMFPICVSFPSTFLGAFLPEAVTLGHHGGHEVVLLVLPLGGKTDRVRVDEAAETMKSIRVSQHTPPECLTCSCRAPWP